MAIHLGTQGWAYRAWVGSFYPDTISTGDMLSAYGEQFSTVEVDETFYGMPPEPLLRKWSDAVPESFKFALKVPQQITHDRRLQDAEQILLRFVDRVRLLGDRLGPLLLQMSPDFAPTSENVAIFEEFLEHMTRELDWAVEFRAPGWIRAEVLSMLRRRGIALAVADGRWFRGDHARSLVDDPTARFLYVRWMGTGEPFRDFGRIRDDRTGELGDWASVLQSASSRADAVFGYFNNRYEGHGPHSVRTLTKMLSQQIVE